MLLSHVPGELGIVVEDLSAGFAHEPQIAAKQFGITVSEEMGFLSKLELKSRGLSCRKLLDRPCKTPTPIYNITSESFLKELMSNNFSMLNYRPGFFFSDYEK